jgi:hypothetical protein
MTFENIVVSVSAVLYLSVGVSYFIKGYPAWGLVWTAYGIANVGLILASPNK